MGATAWSLREDGASAITTAGIETVIQPLQVGHNIRSLILLSASDESTSLITTRDVGFGQPPPTRMDMGGSALADVAGRSLRTAGRTSITSVRSPTVCMYCTTVTDRRVSTQVIFFLEHKPTMSLTVFGREDADIEGRQHERVVSWRDRRVGEMTDTDWYFKYWMDVGRAYSSWMWRIREAAYKDNGMIDPARAKLIAAGFAPTYRDAWDRLEEVAKDLERD